MADKEYIHPIGKKGQVVLPAEFRHALGIKPTDRVTISQEDGQIIIRPTISKALRYQGVAGKAKDGTSDWEQIREKAWEDRVAEIVGEG